MLNVQSPAESALADKKAWEDAFLQVRWKSRLGRANDVLAELGAAPLSPPRSGGAGGAAPSLSECHNCDEGKIEGEKVGRILTGSAAKSAACLRLNAEQLAEWAGINCILLTTFSAGDYHCSRHQRQVPVEGSKGRCPVCAQRMHFFAEPGSTEANRRFKNYWDGVLSEWFDLAIVVKERHEKGGNHFHLFASLKSRADVRTGFDFDRVGARDYRSVSPTLLKLWKVLRTKAPLYGLGGRVESKPIKKTGQAVASYVSKYIEKHVAHRTLDDYGRKLVRYHGFGGLHLKCNAVEWNGKNARAWRSRAVESLAAVGVVVGDKKVEQPPHLAKIVARCDGRLRLKCFDGSAARDALGSRWAFHLTRLQIRLDLHRGDTVGHDYVASQILNAELQRLAGREHCRRVEHPCRVFCGDEWTVLELNDYFASLPAP